MIVLRIANGKNRIYFGWGSDCTVQLDTTEGTYYTQIPGSREYYAGQEDEVTVRFSRVQGTPQTITITGLNELDSNGGPKDLLHINGGSVQITLTVQN